MEYHVTEHIARERKFVSQSEALIFKNFGHAGGQ